MRRNLRVLAAKDAAGWRAGDEGCLHWNAARYFPVCFAVLAARRVAVRRFAPVLLLHRSSRAWRTSTGWFTVVVRAKTRVLQHTGTIMCCFMHRYAGHTRPCSLFCHSISAAPPAKLTAAYTAFCWRLRTYASCRWLADEDMLLAVNIYHFLDFMPFFSRWAGKERGRGVVLCSAWGGHNATAWVRDACWAGRCGGRGEQRRCVAAGFEDVGVYPPFFGAPSAISYFGWRNVLPARSAALFLFRCISAPSTSVPTLILCLFAWAGIWTKHPFPPALSLPAPHTLPLRCAFTCALPHAAFSMPLILYVFCMQLLGAKNYGAGAIVMAARGVVNISTRFSARWPWACIAFAIGRADGGMAANA